MAKKKKTKIQPVTRGFATVSTPKKIEEEPVAPAVVREPTDTREGAADNTLPENTSRPASQDGPIADTDKTEEKQLQNLVDRLQDRVEKEIVRTIKAIETERRAVRSLPSLHLAPELVDSVLSMFKDLQDGEDSRLLDEAEDKALFKLAITYGVLRRLGYAESQVVECLKAISGIVLEEALEWLYTHYPTEEVHDEPPPSSSLLTSSSGTSSQRTMLVSALQQPATVDPKSTLASNSGASLTQNAQLSRKSPPASESSTPSSVVRPLTPAREIVDIGETFEDLNSRYVTIRLKMDEWDRSKHLGRSQTDIQKLRHQLKLIKENYFFDESEAEALYKVERNKADAAALQAKLRGQTQVPKPKSQASTSTSSTPSSSHVATTSSSITDVFEGDDGDSEGGVLDLLEPMPDTQLAEDGTVVNIRDMALPKNWSGRTPKTLLAETVNKADRYAVIAYSIVSGLSRAKRAAVDIRWEGRKASSWSMVDVACHDEGQSEQYIALLALHAITFPKLEGFAASASSSQHITSFRLLPPVFRDLWEELEDRRRCEDNMENRNAWGRLKNILKPKLGTNDKVQASSAKNNGVVGVTRVPKRTTYAQVSDLMDAFAARQSSAAYQKMLIHREKLPIASYRQQIIETLSKSQVLVLCGETGCGKSTQVPSFLLEEELKQGRPCKIICTEPRRISAISLAQRVSAELGDAPNSVGTMSSLVGYAIRLESNTSKNTRLTFMTNGIALRMLEAGSGFGGNGTALDEITHIVVDEVHERTIESDFLLIVLKSLLEQRADLKVILMSATVDAEKMSSYFGGCPVVTVPGRTFPVEIKYLEDAIQFTGWTIPDSSPYARRLHDKFYANKAEWSEDAAVHDDDDDSSSEQTTVKLEKRYTASTVSTINLLDERVIPYPLIVRLLERICLERTELSSYSAAILIFMPGLQEIRRLIDMLSEHPEFGSEDAFKVYPLHSSLTSEEQSAVFDIPPSGIRKIVIATNIAETGVTIPDITCVIDSGKHREMRFDEKRQISRLIETFIARSNAAQRCGRAGRVQNGLAFRLFTRLKHDTQLADHPLPEMMRLSLSDLALRIKILKVNLGATIEEALSRALDPPAPISVQRAVANLKEVRALTSTEELTPLGRVLSKLPTDVALGKFLCLATLFRCLDPALTIAAALNLKSPFVKPFGLEKESDAKAAYFSVENSDFMTLHNVFSIWRQVCIKNNMSFVRKFCRQNFLSHQTLTQIEELRMQFLGYLVDSSLIHADKSFVRELSRMRFDRHRFLTIPEYLNCNSSHSSLLNSALVAGLYPKLLSIDATTRQLRTITNNQSTAIHPSSVNHGKHPGDLGSYLVYFTIMHSKRLYAWETAPVALEIVLPLLCGEAEFKLSSGMITVADKNLAKLKFKLSSRDCLAVKVLREQLMAILAQQLKGKPLVGPQLAWQDLALRILGRMDEVEARVNIS